MARIREEFSGRLCISTMVFADFALAELGYTCWPERTQEQIAGRATFWEDANLEIGLNQWTNIALETQNDQRLSVLAEEFYHYAIPFLAYYRATYPKQPIRLAELGNFNFDGSTRGLAYYLGHPERMQVNDNQEDSDIWAAYLIVSQYVEMTGIPVWSIYPHNWCPGEQEAGDIVINDLPSERCIVEIIGGTLE
jgi:hypothetical protein